MSGDAQHDPAPASAPTALAARLARRAASAAGALARRAHGACALGGASRSRRSSLLSLFIVRDRRRPAEPAVADDAHRLLPALDGRPARRPVAGADAQRHDAASTCSRARSWSMYVGLPGRRCAARRGCAARWVDRGDRGGARDLPARAAAGADGRLQLHQLRAHGGRAPPQPVHDDPDPRAAQRPELRRSATGTSCSAPTARCSR